jgi:acetylglutamate kinase
VLDKDKNLVAEMNEEMAKAMIEDGTIIGGMIPKIETCIRAIHENVGASVIIDGRVEHALLLELFTEHGAGTLIQK